MYILFAATFAALFFPKFAIYGDIGQADGFRVIQENHISLSGGPGKCIKGEAAFSGIAQTDGITIVQGSNIIINNLLTIGTIP